MTQVEEPGAPVGEQQTLPEGQWLGRLQGRPGGWGGSLLPGHRPPTGGGGGRGSVLKLPNTL